ncbi:XTP/dITP diphosphatase [uncultured Clostridium sp.]|uniref:XTP/dITP diphosphatase n=1 Tax=uncultured Clostridium sp. TaxID=59620 RepID=UPI00262FF44F|nr:XTP/dITP diphosphatase [uncultured Clostridium sp.]
MTKLILASNNEKKIEEIKEILKDLSLEIKSLKDEGIDIDVVEDGDTFKANSFKKANEIKEYLLSKGKENFIVMADDSGLMVDYLNGAPGVYSARYAGEHGNDEKNNKKLLRELSGVEGDKRGAKFICYITLVNDKNDTTGFYGEVEGQILEELNGAGGFGYDPLFFNEELKKTFGEASKEEKNKISHRGNALKQLGEEIKKLL